MNAPGRRSGCCWHIATLAWSATQGAGTQEGIPVLARGFALVRDLDGRQLRTAAAIVTGTRLDIELSDGRVRALAEAKSAQAATDAPPRRRRRGGGGPEGQGSLFGA